MGNGDPVTQRQFAETAARDKKEVLDAIEKVNGTVHNNNVALAKMEAKLEQVDDLKNQVGSLKTWDRVDTVITAVVTAALAGLGINRGQQ